MIVTFYSFKGGVGRSMALANVARWLYHNGLRVAVVDWDLEAPGVENFFVADLQARRQVRSLPGLMDLLAGYLSRWANLPWPRPDQGGTTPSSDGTPDPEVERRAFDEGVAMLKANLPPLVYALQPMPDSPAADGPANSGALWLLSAGARDGDHFSRYADNVQGFDWARFYAEFRGEAFFEWLRGELENIADITLIDSRTGVTEMGGVCTRHLADVVVAMCAPNEANLAGTERIIDSLSGESLSKARRGRPLDFIPVPARVDRLAENTRRNEWRDNFLRRMGSRLGVDAQAYWDLHVPYVPYYAFEEKLVIGESDRSEDLDRAYRGLGLKIAQHYADRVDTARRQAVLARRGWQDDTVQKMLFDPQLILEAAWQEFPETQRGLVQRLLLRFVQLSPSAPDTCLADVLDPARLPADEHALADVLLANGMLREVRGENDWRRLHLAHDDFVKWPRLQGWLKADREFLLWRQQLESFTGLWAMTEGRDEGALISGEALARAEAYAAQRPADLLPEQVRFIEASRGFARRLAEDRALASQTQILQRELDRYERVASAAEAPPPPVSVPPRHRWLAAAGLVVVAMVGAWLMLSGRLSTSDTSPTKPGTVQAVSTDALAKDARDALQRGDSVAAQNSAERILALLPADPTGYLLRGAALALRPGSEAAARSDYLKAIELGAGAPAYQAAVALMSREGDLAGAKALLDKGLADRPDDAALSLLMADVQAAAGDQKQALASYDKVVKADPNNAQARFGRARLLLIGLKRGEEARGDLEAVLKLPIDQDTRLAAGALLEKLGSGPKSPNTAAAKIQVYVHFYADDGVGNAEAVAKRLNGAGFAVPMPERRPEKVAGDIRYYFPEDAKSAQTIKSLSETALAEQGRPLRLALRALSPKEFPKARPGVVELWLPPDAAVLIPAVQMPTKGGEVSGY